MNRIATPDGGQRFEELDCPHDAIAHPAEIRSVDGLVLPHEIQSEGFAVGLDRIVELGVIFRFASKFISMRIDEHRDFAFRTGRRNLLHESGPVAVKRDLRRIFAGPGRHGVVTGDRARASTWNGEGKDAYVLVLGRMLLHDRHIRECR